MASETGLSAQALPRRGVPTGRSGRRAEHHLVNRIGWLRAAVLGANDGIVSTASLVLGVAAAGAEQRTLLLTSVSGLIAGAMSMAAGEFVSVHSQQDTEQAELALERAELKRDPAGERRELAGLYVGRGLDPALADQVAAALTAPDTISALPERTLKAFADHGRLGALMPADGGYADVMLEEFRREGVDDGDLAARLQRDGVESAAMAWHSMLARLAEQSAACAVDGVT